MAQKTPTRAEEPVQKYTKVLVAYDGSPNAKRALTRAAHVASGTGASLRVVVVVNPITPSYGPIAPNYPQDFIQRIMSEADRALKEALAMCAGVKGVSGSVEEGRPAETILAVAKREGSDLIVVGRRGISGVERFLLGGVSNNVVNNSACDVLVVK